MRLLGFVLLAGVVWPALGGETPKPPKAPAPKQAPDTAAKTPQAEQADRLYAFLRKCGTAKKQASEN